MVQDTTVTRDVVTDNAVQIKATHLEPKETKNERLERVQTRALIEVGNRIRQPNGELTSSPGALSLARQVATCHPASQTPPKPSTTTMVVSSPPAKAELNGKPAMPASSETPSVQPAIRHAQEGSASEAVNSPIISKRGGGGRGRRGARIFHNTRGRSAVKGEPKPAPRPSKSVDGNACASDIPSDAETASGDSVAPVNKGRVVRKNPPAGPDASLTYWDGNWRPPPVDWDERPRFNNSSCASTASFGRWNETTAAQSLNKATGVPFTRLSKDLVESYDLHPDGLDLVDQTMNVDIDTAERYGYLDPDALETIRHDAQLIDPRIFEDDWGKLDMRDAENVKFKDERCEDLLRNYNANLAKGREEEIDLRRAQKLTRTQQRPVLPAPNPHMPRINIYLRPAVESDLDQLVEIYNYYVKNSVRTSEAHPITVEDMQDRWRASTEEKLPFLVAVSKSAIIRRGAGNAVEKVVGWASATDWVNRYSVERFTVELEIYVHHQNVHQGVGKCLMDKLMDSTDRGHVARQGYPFICAPEMQHAYCAGGARNLMKLIIMVRNLDKPKRTKEDDFPWIKKWLEENWSFEQQGSIKRVGVKFKRYVNHSYFVRSTAYAPAEYKIPEDIR